MTDQPPEGAGKANGNGSGESPTYRIGAVSRLTGIPADTLRVWERRYGVVTPIRADSGTRLYGPEDVARLTLIKRLVDRGDAISSVASLSLAQLRERVSGADLAQPEQDLGRPCRVAVLGPALSERLRQEVSALEGVELVGLYQSAESFLAESRGLAPDLVLFDYPTVHGDQIREIGSLFTHSGAARAVLIYRFATSATLQRLDSRRILARRAPLDPGELRHWCLALHPPSRRSGSDLDGTRAVQEPDISLPIPPRQFADRQLVRIAAEASAVRCECPRHLTDLISALAAFEAYSEECENRHAEDAALHAFLHASTAQARSLMESALARVVEAEAIAIDEGAGPGTGDWADSEPAPS